MRPKEDPNAALLPDPDLWQSERAGTVACPYMEHYKPKGSRFFWGMAIGLIIGIVLCLAGIVMATKY